MSSAPWPTREELSGRVLGGRYRLVRPLGEGGMGVVYEAWQEDLGRAVAVKLITATGPEPLARFQREARAAAALGHPHIVQVFDFQTPAGEPPFLVMELLQGRSLQQLIRLEGPMSAARVARIGLHVLAALGAAHRAGIVHRDIKPANVFCASSPTLGEVAKVLDFGVAKLLGGHDPMLTGSGDVVGTVAYMSPEQARGGAIDGRSDLYSLAACLYHATARRPPIAGETTTVALLAIVEGRVPPLEQLRPDLDPSFCAIVRQGMSVDPAARFVSAEHMAEVLGAWLARAPAEPAAPVSLQAGWSPQGAAAAGPPSGVGPSVPLAFATAATSQPHSLAASPGSPGPSGHWPPTGVTRPGAMPPTAAPASRSRAGVVILGVGAVALVLVGGTAAALLLGGYELAAPSGSSRPVAPGSSSSASGSKGVVAETGSSATAGRGGGQPRSPGPLAAGKTTATGPGTSGLGAATTSTATAAGTSTPAGGQQVGRACPRGDSDCGWQGRCVAGRCECITGGRVLACAGFCRDSLTDPNNCGKCGVTCPAGEVCQGYRCVRCSDITGWIECGGQCVDARYSSVNCGGCGRRCLGGEHCISGTCRKP